MPAVRTPKNRISEEEIQEALKAIQDGTVKSAYEAEKKFGVPSSTLTRRMNGTTQPIQLAHEADQLFSRQEELVMENRCKHLTRAGYPARHNFLKEMGEDIQANRVSSVNTPDSYQVSYPPIGKG
jgi:hypothetical protein